ncbi:MAG: hypothetical protein V3T31_03475, partial [candidate division Zixibacteria bacterium]
AAGPKLTQAFAAIAEVKPDLKELKLEHFNQCRAILADQVQEYAQAASSGNGQAAVKILPDLHSAFEKTTSVLLPVNYAQFDGFMITLELIIDTHLPQNNRAGIVGSLGTLVTKAQMLNERTLPVALQWSKEEIVSLFDKIATLANEAARSANQDDMKRVTKLTDQIEQLATEFSSRYL